MSVFRSSVGTSRPKNGHSFWTRSCGEDYRLCVQKTIFLSRRVRTVRPIIRGTRRSKTVPGRVPCPVNAINANGHLYRHDRPQYALITPSSNSIILTRIISRRVLIRLKSNFSRTRLGRTKNEGERSQTAVKCMPFECNTHCLFIPDKYVCLSFERFPPAGDDRLFSKRLFLQRSVRTLAKGTVSPLNLTNTT